MKPTEKKATTRKSKVRRRKSAVRKPPAAKPVDVVETAPPSEPEQPPTQDVVQEPETAPVEVVEPEAPAKAPKKDAHSEAVSIGSVECRLKRLPVEVVLGLLDPDGLRRIEAEKSTASFESTRKRLLDTDGRATPIVFEDGDPPSILHGYSELAAAEDCGVNEVSVILVPEGGASDAQSHIVEMVRQQRDQKAGSEDEELFYRVHAEG
jgi:hypothetical protein